MDLGRWVWRGMEVLGLNCREAKANFKLRVLHGAAEPAESFNSSFSPRAPRLLVEN